MKTAIVIPARYASSRLPAKPLLRETGKYLIQHVYERACESKADTVIVATDDARIFQAVESFGGNVVMTRQDHPSGTDRVAEVAANLDADIIVNVQGDEPMIEPGALDMLARLLDQDRGAKMATLATPIATLELLRDPNCVKVVCDKQGRALYFSRSPIPRARDWDDCMLAADPPHFYQHVGLYAYRREFLLKLAAMPPSSLEQIEKLEQLRVLQAGYEILVGVIDEPTFGIDTPEDYAAFVAKWRG